ncbi:hypothetical protein BDV25DRAFT_163560 [Aspergillus avenaceus]|uniref:Uncharacterized protein n=1 Tax=Aspergillus avenaceus TaxID=36643 RepID=A0A5N6TIK4_ASPAV|nr:hypothetical protein BDV25DRAFT_163560 [Aspergillus avenaceus]
MLLTLKPSQNGIKGPHDYAIIRQSIPTPRSSPPPASEPSGSIVVPRKISVDHSMEPSRGGLPPPSSLALPPPDVAFSHMNSAPQPLPRPPAPRQSSDDAHHYWHAKAEEDRRRQEEERTRQESLRLEQRRVEQSMLRDSLQAGVPPHMIPLIFAGISQGGVPQSVLELTHQYMTQPTGGARAPAAPPPVLSHPPSHRRGTHSRGDSRSIPAVPYVAQQPQQVVPPPGILLSQPLPPSGPSPHSLSRAVLPNGPADPRGPSRPNPGDPQQPPINLSNVHYAPGSSIPALQHAAGKPEHHRRQSPSLYFHHWVPPNQNQPNTPGRPRQESPIPAHGSRRLEYQQSPPGRKRKATGPHQQAPLPSSRPSETAPSSSQASRPGSPLSSLRQAESSAHRRQHSDVSMSYEPRALEQSSLRHNSNAMSPRHMVPPREGLGFERDRGRVDILEHRGEMAPMETGIQPSVSQPQYSSSVGTAPPDSDLDSSPSPSPTSGVPQTSSFSGAHGAAPPAQ